MKEELNEGKVNLKMEEETKRIGLIGTMLLVAFGLMLFFGKECNREGTKERQLYRDSVAKCIAGGVDPIHCKEAMQKERGQ